MDARGGAADGEFTALAVGCEDDDGAIRSGADSAGAGLIALVSGFASARTSGGDGSVVCGATAGLPGVGSFVVSAQAASSSAVRISAGKKVGFMSVP
jgi:hypothetical protein